MPHDILSKWFPIMGGWISDLLYWFDSRFWLGLVYSVSTVVQLELDGHMQPSRATFRRDFV